jgi:hypothetical protein
MGALLSVCANLSELKRVIVLNKLTKPVGESSMGALLLVCANSSRPTAVMESLVHAYIYIHIYTGI